MSIEALDYSGENPEPSTRTNRRIGRQAIADADGEPHVRTVSNPEDITSSYIRDIGRVPLLNAEDEVELAKCIEAGSYAEQLIRAIKDEGHPQWKESMMLSDLERSYLPQLQSEGQAAKQQMIEANTALVVHWAKKYDARGLSLLDVVQEGNLGLMHAVDKFDYKMGYKFSTYASRWIRKYITQGIANQSRTIRAPQEVAEQYNKYLRVKRELMQEIGSEPTIEEMAEQLSIEPEEALEFEVNARPPMSLQKPVTNRNLGAESDLTLQDILTEREASAEVEKTVSYAVFLDEMKELFAEFDNQEKRIIQMYYGFDGGKQVSRREIGEKLGISGAAVRQIEIRLIKRLNELGWAERLEIYKDLFNE